MIRYALDMKIEPFDKRIGFNDQIILLGSCFSEHIADRLKNFSFNVISNPNGIVFNPISLAVPLERFISKQPYVESDLVFNPEIGLWYGLFHHGKIFSSSSSQLLIDMEKLQLEFNQKLESAQWLLLTFGTAWVYNYTPSDSIVANCHKMPQQHFTKRLLNVEEVVVKWKKVVAELKRLNPLLNIVYTVSPVKHLRDGVHENNLSKSVLLLAVQELLNSYSFYFPSYELVTDDLRDYRFFDSDGAHPIEQAIEHVFEKFKEHLLTAECLELINELQSFFNFRNHRLLNTSKENLAQRAHHLLMKKQQLLKQFPALKLEE